MSIVTAYREKQEQKREHFSQFIIHFVNPNMWMLTFNVVLGYQGLLFRDFSWFFFSSIWLTNPISGNVFNGKQRKKRGWPYWIGLHIFAVHPKAGPKKGTIKISPNKTLQSLFINVAASQKIYVPVTAAIIRFNHSLHVLIHCIEIYRNL